MLRTSTIGYEDRNGGDPNYRPRRDDRGDDGRYSRYDNYENHSSYRTPGNRTPSGVVLGSPTIIYGSNTGANLVSARILLGRDGSQYLGKKVTVSGRYSGVTTVAGQKGWQIGGDGVFLPVQGTPPTDRDGLPVTVTGFVRQTSNGQVYLALP